MNHLEEAKTATEGFSDAWANTSVNEGAQVVIATALEAIAHALIALAEQGKQKASPAQPDYSKCHHGNRHGHCPRCPEPDLSWML